MGLTKVRARFRIINQEYGRIEAILIPLGFTLYGKDVFYGKSPFSLYIGEMQYYQEFIDNLHLIKERFLKQKSESLGIFENSETSI